MGKKRPGARKRPTGFVIPYPLDKIFRGFGRCKGGKRQHAGIDLGGVGPDWGLGTPIRSIARSEIVTVGSGQKSRWRYGYPDTRKGHTWRRRWKLPRSRTLPGYGLVHFFTRNYGFTRTGTLIVAKVLDGDLKNHVIRYMHLGAVHSRVVEGAVVEPGQEIGVLGGTAVQVDAPHVHIDMTRPDGSRVDMVWLFGKARRHRHSCRPWRKSTRKPKRSRSKKGGRKGKG